MLKHVKYRPYHSRSHTQIDCPFCGERVLEYKETLVARPTLVDPDLTFIISEKGRTIHGRNLHTCPKYIKSVKLPEHWASEK